MPVMAKNLCRICNRMIFWNSFRNHEHNYQATRTRLINLKFLLAPYFRHVLAETWGLLLYRINI